MKQILAALLTKKREKEKPVSSKLSEAKEKRDKMTRIRSYDYQRLAKLGYYYASKEWKNNAPTKVLDHYYKAKAGRD
ncbi:MAG: hypothetical protein M3311_08350 [Thermoproteota archaeon]|nr:hypothetical protein [Thermoproteota archaeon]